MARIMLLLLTLGLSSAEVLAVDPAPAVYSGEYFYNFETASFTPDGQKECWVVRGGMKSAEIPSEDGSPAWGTAHVVVRGIVSTAGHYGNLGGCTHELRVIEILAISDQKTKS